MTLDVSQIVEAMDGAIAQRSWDDVQRFVDAASTSTLQTHFRHPSLFIHAAERGSLEALRILAPKSNPHSLKTALMIAVELERLDMVECLIPWTDPNARNNIGQPAAMMALLSNKTLDCFKALVPVTDLTLTHSFGHNVALCAAEISPLEALKRISSRVDLSKPTFLSDTPSCMPPTTTLWNAWHFWSHWEASTSPTPCKTPH